MAESGSDKRVRVSHVVPARTPGNPYVDNYLGAIDAAGCTVARAGNARLFLRRALRNKSDVIHLHWNSYLIQASNPLVSWGKVIAFAAQLVLARLLGTRIVWTVHNLAAHEGRLRKQDFAASRIAAKLSHMLIVHCESARQLVARKYKLRSTDRIRVVMHAAYETPGIDETDRQRARSAAGLDDPTVAMLFFGRVRAYKGVLDLIKAFSDLADSGACQHPIRLVIAGKPDDASRAAIEALPPRSDLDLRLGFVDDADLPTLFAAADVCVLPYRDVLSSGSALMALAYGRTIAAPRIGCMPDVAPQEHNFLYDPEQESGLRDTLAAACATPRDQLSRMGQQNRDLADTLTWSGMGQQTASIYRELLA